MQLARHYLESIANIGIFPLISLFIFLSFFTVMIIHTFSLSQDFTKEASEMPLDDKIRTKQLDENDSYLKT